MAPRSTGSLCFVLAAGLLCGALGCARIERAQECQRLASIVNETLDEVEALEAQNPPTRDAGVDAALPNTARAPAPPDAGVATSPAVSAYRKMSKLYLSLSQDLAKIELKDKTLAQQVALYGRLMKRTSRALDRLLEAHNRSNYPGVRAALTELEHLRERQHATSQQIDQICLRP